MTEASPEEKRLAEGGHGQIPALLVSIRRAAGAGQGIPAGTPVSAAQTGRARAWIGDAAERGMAVRDLGRDGIGNASILEFRSVTASAAAPHGSGAPVPWRPGGEGAWLFHPFSNSGPDHADARGWLQVIFIQVGEEHEDEFNEWYDREHIERLRAVPELRSVHRYRSAVAPWTYMAVWNVDAPDVLVGPLWRQRAETPWTRRVRRFMRNRVRYIVQPMEDVQGHLPPLIV